MCTKDSARIQIFRHLLLWDIFCPMSSLDLTITPATTSLFIYYTLKLFLPTSFSSSLFPLRYLPPLFILSNVNHSKWPAVPNTVTQTLMILSTISCDMISFSIPPSFQLFFHILYNLPFISEYTPFSFYPSSFLPFYIIWSYEVDGICLEHVSKFKYLGCALDE